MPQRKTLLILLAAAFLFRLFFGLSRAQFQEIDQFQTYLIGLKCYTTQTWPWFGPDVNGVESSFQSQIPGALEGLLIALPLTVLPIPEAPFIFLNLLSVIGVALLAWYIARRLPGIPFVWAFVWIAIAPWSIHESTVMINPAFTFLPSILFFIGFMESLPVFSLGLVPPRWANAAMGFSLFWIMQFHFSYVYLVPLAGLSLAYQVWKKRLWSAPLFFFLGALPMAGLILPTYLKFGLARGNVAGGFTVPFNWEGVGEFWTILARFLSLVSFELPRFIGINTHTRFDFLFHQHPILLLPGLLLWGLGLIQPFLLASIWFNHLRETYPAWFKATVLFLCGLFFIGGDRRTSELLGMMAGILLLTWAFGKVTRNYPAEKSGPRWKEFTLLLTGIFAMVFVSFWFTIKMPLSHIYFVLFPFIMTFSFYGWAAFKNNPHFRALGKTFVILGVLFQLGYAIVRLPVDSFYGANENGPGIKRDILVRVIQEKDYRIWGERRKGSLY
jgi:hypothetical protein